MSTRADRALIVEAAQREEEFLAAKEAYYADPNAEGAFDRYREAKLAFGEWRRGWRALRELARAGVLQPDGNGGWTQVEDLPAVPLDEQPPSGGVFAEGGAA